MSETRPGGAAAALQQPVATGGAPDEYGGTDQYLAQQAWLGLIRGHPSPEHALSGQAQWQAFIDEATRHELRSLTYRLLADDTVLGAPESLLETLRPQYVQTAVRNAHLFKHSARMARVLGERGISVMLLKGMHLARFVYAEPALRTMADVDILVRREHLAEAERVFLEHGYGPTPRPDLEEFCRWSNHLAKLSKPDAPVFEVHWHIERPTSPFTIDIEGLWERSQAATLESVPVRLPAPEDAIIHLALHGSYHHRFDRSALKGMVDIHTLVVRQKDAIDWAALVKRAIDWGAAGFLYSTLRLTTDILGTPVPESVLRDLPRQREDEDVIDVARRFILVPRPEVPKAYVKLARSTTLRERVRLLIENLFLPRAKMERVYRLRRGSPLVWAYYPIRVVTLVVKRTGLSLGALFRTRKLQAPLTREEERLRIQAWVKDLPGDHRPPWLDKDDR
jgi:hypothetical protein